MFHSEEHSAAFDSISRFASDPLSGLPALAEIEKSDTLYHRINCIPEPARLQVITNTHDIDILYSGIPHKRKVKKVTDCGLQILDAWGLDPGVLRDFFIKTYHEPCALKFAPSSAGLKLSRMEERYFSRKIPWQGLALLKENEVAAIIMLREFGLQAEKLIGLPGEHMIVGYMGTDKMLISRDELIFALQEFSEYFTDECAKRNCKLYAAVDYNNMPSRAFAVKSGLAPVGMSFFKKRNE